MRDQGSIVLIGPRVGAPLRPSARMRWLLSLMLMVLTPVAWTAEITGGPMAGYPAMRAMQIWLQADGAGQADIEYWPEDRPTEAKLSAPQVLTPEQDYTAKIDIGGLEPGSAFEYRVRIDGAAAGPPAPLRFRTQPSERSSKKPPSFSVALGSCTYINDPTYDRPGAPYGGGYEIFDAIAATTPAMMLWLGDNVYLRKADYDSAWGMNDRYRRARSYPPLQRLLQGTHHLATWDDHDFGPDNANGAFVLKGAALELFKRYWPNPSFGLPDAPGVYSAVRYGDAEFFLLDDRYYREADSDKDRPGKAMLGAVQMRWLKDSLLASTAAFKVIASGSQLLHGELGFESWIHFPAERDVFLDWLARNSVSGVVLLSGDRHRTRLQRMERRRSYPLYELTCSPLTAGVSEKDLSPSRWTVEGTEVSQRNFCLLSFSGQGVGRSLTIAVHGTHGQPIWSRVIPTAELQ